MGCANGMNQRIEENLGVVMNDGTSRLNVYGSIELAKDFLNALKDEQVQYGE